MNVCGVNVFYVRNCLQLRECYKKYVLPDVISIFSTHPPFWREFSFKVFFLVNLLPFGGMGVAEKFHFDIFLVEVSIEMRC